MNIEFEVKNILREGISPEMKADKICKFANFNKEKVINAIRKGGTIFEIYSNIIK